MLTIILIALLVIAIAGAGWGYPQYGYVGFSPAGLILILMLILWGTGHMTFR